MGRAGRQGMGKGGRRQGAGRQGARFNPLLRSCRKPSLPIRDAEWQALHPKRQAGVGWKACGIDAGALHVEFQP